MPENYSWSNCGVSVPEEFWVFFFFLLSWNKDCRISYKITKKWSIETFHCNIIQMLNLESGRGYRTFTSRVILVFCSREVKMDHLEFIKTLLNLLFGKQSSCRKMFVWQASFLARYYSQWKKRSAGNFLGGCTCFFKSNFWLSVHA